MEAQNKSINVVQAYVNIHSRRRYEVNSDRNKGMLKHLPESTEENSITKKNSFKNKPEFKVIKKPKGKKEWLFGPRIIHSNMEYLIEWKDSGVREYITKSELDKLLGK